MEVHVAQSGGIFVNSKANLVGSMQLLLLQKVFFRGCFFRFLVRGVCVCVFVKGYSNRCVDEIGARSKTGLACEGESSLVESVGTESASQNSVKRHYSK